MLIMKATNNTIPIYKVLLKTLSASLTQNNLKYFTQLLFIATHTTKIDSAHKTSSTSGASLMYYAPNLTKVFPVYVTTAHFSNPFVILIHIIL